MWFLRLRAWPSEPESIFIMTLFWMGWCCESCVRGNSCSVNNVFVTELGSFVWAKSQLFNRWKLVPVWVDQVLMLFCDPNQLQ
jgi:hypothetical protein